MKTIALATILALISSRAHGETSVGIANWGLRDNNPVVVIDMLDHLTRKQKNLITSGFSTYSSLQIILPEGKYTPERAIFESQCTIKYDTWEEYYDIFRMDTEKNTRKIKTLQDVVNICLMAEVTDIQALKYFIKKGGKLKAKLQLEQISKDRAKKIRSWLVKQQSQVVRGLFSHMLGDLKLSEEVVITIIIPPKRVQKQKKVEVIAIYPQQGIKL
tara:strand:- start:96 stop:743 length:648 start_codon:yes stop_codon:yes gene_type:complete